MYLSPFVGGYICNYEAIFYVDNTECMLYVIANFVYVV